MVYTHMPRYNFFKDRCCVNRSLWAAKYNDRPGLHVWVQCIYGYMNTQKTTADLHVMRSHPLHRTCFSQYQTSSAAAGVTRRWGLLSHACVFRCWPYPCCAVGSTCWSNRVWPLEASWQMYAWLTIVMHQHENLKYRSSCTYWIMDWNINLVLGVKAATSH